MVASERPAPARNELELVARSIRSLNYGQLMDFADNLSKIMVAGETRIDDVDELAKCLWLWSDGGGE